jgi:lysophospholipase L1-like esterase
MTEEITIICLGDSLTAGDPGFSGYGTWSGIKESQYEYWLEKLLNEEFPDIDFEVINFGVGGNRIWEMLYRFKRDVLRLIPEPDFVLMMGGVNDILNHGSHETGVRKDLEETYDIISESDATIIPLEIGPATVTRRFVERIMKSNAAIHEIAELYEVPYVPIYSALCDEDGFALKNKYDVGDGLHYSVAGYKKIGETVFDVMKKVLHERFE